MAKISLIALMFVTLAVQLTQFYILDSHFRSAIAREVNSAASAHSALAASLSNHAAYERLKANTLFLSTEQLIGHAEGYHYDGHFIRGRDRSEKRRQNPSRRLGTRSWTALRMI